MAKRTDTSDQLELGTKVIEEKCNDVRSVIPPPSPNPIQSYAKTPNILMTLPPEVRNVIYEYVFVCPPGTYMIRNLGETETREPAFLKTATAQMQKEAAPIFYHSNNIHMDLSLDRDDIACTVKSLRTIFDLCGSTPFTNFRLWFHQLEGTDLFELLPLLELIRATGLVLLGPTGKIIACSRCPKVMKEELEGAIPMAMEAHEAGWSESDLAAAFRIRCTFRIPRRTTFELHKMVESVLRLL